LLIQSIDGIAVGRKHIPGGGELLMAQDHAGRIASAPTEHGELRVFISYSRDEVDFADQLELAVLTRAAAFRQVDLNARMVAEIM
jgi:hypothetical protein